MALIIGPITIMNTYTYKNMETIIAVVNKIFYYYLRMTIRDVSNPNFLEPEFLSNIIYRSYNIFIIIIIKAIKLCMNSLLVYYKFII